MPNKSYNLDTNKVCINSSAKKDKMFSWKTVIDFTEIKKGGVTIDEILNSFK